MKKPIHSIVVLLLLVTAIICIRPTEASGTIRILSDGSIDPPGAPISTIDGVTYVLTENVFAQIVVERSNIVINGAGYAVTGDGGGNGFGLHSLSNVTITNTSILNFTYGIYLESTSFTTISLNHITSNGYDGIGFFYSPNNTVIGNSITLNGYNGIEVYSSSSNTITGNNITGNGWFGIGIYYSSGNQAIRNKLRDNYNGIELFYSPENFVFHNDFVNHTAQAYLTSSTSLWDNGYPSGGNYWSDYAGTDSDGDGIGDTAYTIDDSNQDRYPLMNAWTNIVILDLLLPKNVTAKGSILPIKVAVENQGLNTAVFDVSAYANATHIQTTPVTLAGMSSTTLTLTWNTSEFARAYVLTVNASRALGETDLSDSSRTYSVVKVSCIGDINGDYATDAKDFVLVKKAIPSFPGSPKWNPNADINNDLVIDGKDYQIVKTHIPTILP